jgi:type II secretory pathway pseudopilin PulG
MLSPIRQRSFLGNKTFGPNFFAPQGFSLLEPVVAGVLMAVFFTQIVSLFNSNTKAVAFANQIDAADRDIHLALDVVRETAAKYNWCKDGGTVELSDCGGRRPYDGASFYSNNNNLSQNFKNACETDSGTIADRDGATKNLYFYIRDNLSEKPAVNNVKITVLQMDSKEIHRFKMKFEKTINTAYGTRTLSRGFYLIPPVALWCP